ncbi:MAG: DUF5666 domain-containing protein [Terracidiphilus sp.]
MKLRLPFAIVFGFALTLTAATQDAPTPPPAQAPDHGGGWQGQRGGRGGWGEGGFGGGITGTVTEAAADHYTIQTDAGETYTIHFSANTRMMKQMMRQRGERGDRAGSGERGQGGSGQMGGSGNPPQMLKPSEIKVGDVIGAMGEVDAIAKSVGAVAIMQIDPERVRQMREAQANYGKTWLIGKVTAIKETKVTLLGSVDNTTHSFVADENTTFRKHREPVTLADVQVGDTVRIEGAVKDGSFVAATVTVMGMPPVGMPAFPRETVPAATPKP